MTVGLATLVARLQAAVPARNGAPSAEQYSQCVEDAVADLGAARPLTRVATLQVAAGQASYALPADWQRTISLGGLAAGGDGVVISADGLIPVGAGFAERLTYAGQTVMISPIPSYTQARELVYAAGYLLDENESYPALTNDAARLALLKAQSLALDLQANAAAQLAWKYQQGDESVDKTGLVKALREQAAAREQAYQTALRQTAQPYGTRG